MPESLDTTLPAAAPARAGRPRRRGVAPDPAAPSTLAPASPPVAETLTAVLALAALARRTIDPMIVRCLSTLTLELEAERRPGIVDGWLVPTVGLLVRCVDDGAPAEVVAGRIAAISGELAARAAA